MFDYNLTEFSIFYKRIMNIERCLKVMLYNKYTQAHGDSAYHIVYRYIREIEKFRNDKDKAFTKIFESKKSNNEKLENSINKMYISEILNLFANKIFLKNKKIRKNFFYIPVITNSTEFQQRQRYLKEFRNCIAHFNYKKFQLDKQKYIESLLYFEKILNCNILINHDILEKINKSRKLSLKEILELIYNINPEYFKDDKLLILLFDDIALINGYLFKELPQRKSIIREHFKILSRVKLCEIIPKINFDNYIQTKLDLY